MLRFVAKTEIYTLFSTGMSYVAQLTTHTHTNTLNSSQFTQAVLQHLMFKQQLQQRLASSSPSLPTKKRREPFS